MNEPQIEQAIANRLAQSERGVSIDELCQTFGDQVSRRTLQRRLDAMFKLGLIDRRGKARATRYHSNTSARTVTVPAPAARHSPIVPQVSANVLCEDTPALPGSTPSIGPELSAESRQLRDIIRQPQGLRNVVGYERKFLERYIPNETSYLSEGLREHLHKVGQSDEMAAMPPGTYARQVLDRLVIDLSWNSSRLEGSTYSLLETDHLISLGKTGDEARYMEAQMILNHKAAIEFLVEAPEELGFNRYTLLNLHAILTEGLLKNAKAEGALRSSPVMIGGSVFHPINQPAIIEECFDLILKKAAAIRDPLECCFFLMVQMPYLQPFEDGNKRTSRLAANMPLIQKNMAPLSFVDVPTRDYADGVLAVYELNRIELLRDVFVWAYERSAGRYAAIRQEIGEPDPIHLRYRMEIKERIRDVVVNRMDKPMAARALQRWALQNVTASDRAHFIEVVEERLLALNEGSIARVRVRPSEFAAWWPIWTGRP